MNNLEYLVSLDFEMNSPGKGLEIEIIDIFAENIVNLDTIKDTQSTIRNVYPKPLLKIGKETLLSKKASIY